MSDRLIVPSGMSRRHFLGHMATTALAVPAMQFAGALQAKGPVDAFFVNRIYLAALSRRPTARELGIARGFLSNNPDPVGVLEDMFWALLNSNEFVLNR